MGQITATRLLPHGHAFFLTPSFLVAEPEKAYALVKWFGDRGKGKFAKSTPGTWKLVCAHNIRQYLLDLAIEKSAERDEVEAELQGQARKDAAIEEKGLSWATCSYRFQLHELIADMLSQPVTKDYSDYDPDLPDESRSPILYADVSIDADEEKALVTWFAGWAMCRLDRFRKFTVVGTDPTNEKRAVRVVTTRSKFSEVGERASPKPKESSNAEISNDPDRPLVAVSPASAAKARLAVASKLKSAFPSSASGASPLSSPQTVMKIKGLAASMSASVANAPTKPPFPPAQGSGSIGKYSVNQSSRVVGTIGSHTVTLPPSESAESPVEDSDVEMSIETTDSPSELVGPRHGIDMQAAPETLQFIASTGANMETANIYLSRSDDNVNRAIHLYSTETSAMSEEGRDAAFPPQFNNISMFSPQQFDGAGDERPRSSGANSVSSSVSGIQSDETGRRFVPSSVRSGGTVRPELSIRTGYVPREDRDSYRAPLRRHMDGEGSTSSSRNVSGRGSSIIGTTVARMEVDSSPVQEKGGDDTGAEVVTAETIGKDVQYEATTTWYERWYKEGKGWEHVHVESWAKAWKFLGVKEG